MLSTTAAIFAAIALLMPGFIVAELSVARSARSSRSDLELALRSLIYTLIIHLAAGYWTVHLIHSIGAPEAWPDHLGALTLYVLVVLLVVPALVGMGLNRFLANAERNDRPPNMLAAALGAGEARDAFDYAYQRWRTDGGWIIVELVGHTAETPRLVGGVYGKKSAAGQTPSPHDLYLEALCLVDEDEQGLRRLTDRVAPDQGVYIPAGQIARIDLLPPREPVIIKR